MLSETSPVLRDASDNRTVRVNGAQLAALRRARALTREQLAAAADGPHRLSEATIKRAESGARVYLETVRRLASILDVPVGALIAEAAGEPAPAAESPSASPGTAVAVLPFRPLDDEQGTRSLADGLAEDLTTRLACWWFPVICRGSTSQYRASLGASESATGVTAGIAAELSVAYLVTGTVQQRGDSVRVHARLLDARSHGVLWAQEYNRAMSKLFALQDDLAADILDSVNRKLLLLTERQLAGRHAGELSAWELAARGSHQFYEGTRESNLRARALLHDAIAQDRALGWAMYLLAMTFQRELVNQWSDAPHDALARLRELSGELQRHHPTDGRTDVVLAYVHVYEGQRQRAIERLERTIEAHPNLNVAYSLLGQAMAMGGHAEPAFEQLELATRLSPRDSDLWSVRTATALAYFVAEDYAHAVQWASSAVELRPEVAFTHGALAASLALLGDRERAASALSEMRRLHPGVSARGFDPILASTEPAIAVRYLEALRLAGL